MKKRTTIILPPDLHEQATAQAKAEDRSFASLVVRAVRSYLAHGASGQVEQAPEQVQAPADLVRNSQVEQRPVGQPKNGRKAARQDEQPAGPPVVIHDKQGAESLARALSAEPGLRKNGPLGRSWTEGA